MIRTAGATFALFAILGCATTPSRSNGRMVRSLYESFARGDAPAVLAAFDQNIVWNEAEGIAYADRNPYRGPQAVAEGVFGRLMSEWDGFRLRVDEVVDGGETVVVLGRYTATYKATGKPLDAPFAHVWKVVNGKVTHFQQYTDTGQWARAQMR